MSGIFETHALSTNYRSNQAILDFANVALADIEANHIANIQLQANQMTVDSTFEQKVAFQYCNMVKKRELTNYISTEMSSNIKDWIDPLIARGEQVAFLAHARRSVNAIEESLKTLYPTKTISNLVPNKPYASTIISKYIKKF